MLPPGTCGLRSQLLGRTPSPVLALPRVPALTALGSFALVRPRLAPAWRPAPATSRVRGFVGLFLPIRMSRPRRPLASPLLSVAGPESALALPDFAGAQATAPATLTYVSSVNYILYYNNNTHQATRLAQALQGHSNHPLYLQGLKGFCS